MSLGQHGLSPGPSSPPQTHVHDPGSNPGIHGGGVVHVGSLADKLRLAASKGQTDKVQDLLQAGATFSPDRDGRTALHYAAQNGYADTCKLLIEKGCDLDCQDAMGYTALLRASSQGLLDVVRICLEAGCNVDFADEHGNTALHEAAWHGFSKTLELLIKYNANVVRTNKSGFTALHLAAQNGHNESSRVLLYGGVNADLQNNQNETAADVARRKEHPEIILIITSLSRPHSTGPRQREIPGVTFKDDIELVDGPVVCADDEPPLKPEKQEKERRFFPFFKKKKKYYRDLAGNIKQGPIGYSPVCQCGPTFNRMEKSLHETRDQLYEHIDASHQVLKDRIEQLDQRTAQQAHSLDRLTRERLEAERRACQAASG
nr:hypothetical protein BaRGS_022822 [Batillaria attramentaria]